MIFNPRDAARGGPEIGSTVGDFDAHCAFDGQGAHPNGPAAVEHRVRHQLGRHDLGVTECGSQAQELVGEGMPGSARRLDIVADEYLQLRRGMRHDVEVSR